MNIFKQTPNFDILGKRRYWITASIVLNLIAVLFPLVKAPNWGVDFAGGTEIQVQFATDVNADKVTEALEKAGLTDTTIQQFGRPEDHEFLLRARRATRYTNEEFATQVEGKLREALPNLLPGKQGIDYDAAEGDQITLTAPESAGLNAEAARKAFGDIGVPLQDLRAITEGRSYSAILRGVSDKVEQALKESLPDAGGQVRRVESVGASVGSELKFAAIKSLLLSLVLILLYVGFRFDFAFATGAIFSLVHDALIVIGFYFVSGAELNTSTIAAVLTIVGYSVNDTVIIYDRIRENLQKHPGRDLYRLINDSVNETLSRTIITHVTVLLSLIGLIVFVHGSLREFALAMAVGVFTGTYSSVYIASPVVLWLDGRIQARRAAQAPTSGGGNGATPART